MRTPGSPTLKFGNKSSRYGEQAALRLAGVAVDIDRMHLKPKLPPGRASRKALAFSGEIHRLRAEGYTFEAIRLALADVGVKVSLTTIKREAAKQPGTPHMASMTSEPHTGPSSAPSSFDGDSRTGREIAQDFMKDRISNPFILERMQDEARSD